MDNTAICQNALPGSRTWLKTGSRSMKIQFGKAVPTFCIFSLEKAREFYLDFLGFKVDWEYRFDPTAPVYMQISRDGLALHLSEHHGDGTPGSIAYVYTTGVVELHRE